MPNTIGLGNVPGLSCCFMNIAKIISDQKKLCPCSGRLAGLTLEQDIISGTAHAFVASKYMKG